MSSRRLPTNFTHITIRTRPTGSFRTTQQQHYQTTRQQQLQPAYAHADTPYFSVIICTYNRRSMVLTALASIRKQTLSYEKFEVIVVDNGSSDGTYNAVQTYLNANHIHSPQHNVTQAQLRAQCLLEERNGLAYARNTGLVAASGEIVVFLDDDIIAGPHFLEQLYKTYQETDADAIGGSVDLHWEAPRPYWLSDDLLDTFGRYKPLQNRSRMPTGIDFSNSCFSVKRTALQNVGGFSSFLSKRLNTPINVEVNDLCRRLRQAGYQLWYEPDAQVLHRVSQARLERAFMIGRAYWQGRSEVLADYFDVEQYQEAQGKSLLQTVRSLLPEIGEMLHILLIHRLLLYMARRPMSERIYAAMAQSRCWGRIHQQFMLSNHAPATTTTPTMLVVRADEEDALPLIRALQSYGVSCTSSIADIPFAWLWHHRAYHETAIGMVHLYRPGAFRLDYRQRRHLLFKLWLAQRLGICIASTDAGGWWQNVLHLHYMQQRAFERRIFASSQLIHTFVRRPEQFYAEYRWVQRVCFLAYPGLRGTLPLLEAPDDATRATRAAYTERQRQQARIQLGVPAEAGYIYLCFAHLHSEREVLQLIEAFSLLHESSSAPPDGAHEAAEPLPIPQLLLVGMPHGKALSTKIMRQAAFNSAIHIFVQYHQADLVTYIAAANALVMPYLAIKAAGVIDLAMLFYSYERIVIAPELPRFYGVLPPYARIQYKPSSTSELAQALATAQHSTYQHTTRESLALNSDRGWAHYVNHMMDAYKQLLIIKKKG